MLERHLNSIVLTVLHRVRTYYYRVRVGTLPTWKSLGPVICLPIPRTGIHLANLGSPILP